MRSEFTCKCSSSSDVSDVLLLSACLQLKYSIVQKQGIGAILRLWARIYCWEFSVEQFDEYMGSLIRKFEKQDGKPLSTAKLIRAVRLRSAGIRGNILELPFVVECLNRLRHAKHVFVSNRSRKSKQRQQWLMHLDLVVQMHLAFFSTDAFLQQLLQPNPPSLRRTSACGL